MKDLYIVANWKENKSEEESLNFLNAFAKVYQPRPDVKVVICPSYSSLSAVSNFIKDHAIAVETGTQDVSELEEGAHTGEVSASQAAEFAKYSIIGHSERRKLGETDEDVSKKVEMAVRYNLKPIVCVINENVPIPTAVKIVAYEPVEAIGTGNPDTPENANRVAAAIKSKYNGVLRVLYGGSVTSKNVRNFCEMENVAGVLVGGASLDPVEFSSIIKQC